MSKYNLSDPELESRVPFPVRERVEDCYLKEVRKHPANQDGKFGVSVEFEFHYLPSEKSTPGYGAILKHREFDPEGSNNIEMDESRLTKSIKLSMTRIKHILGCYISNDKLDKINVNSFEELVDLIVSSSTLKNSKNIKTALKVTYNSKNISSLPKVPDFISTDMKPRVFSSDPTWDKYEKTSSSPNVYNSVPVDTQYNTNDLIETQIEEDEDDLAF
jgi:hypothetical protein